MPDGQINAIFIKNIIVVFFKGPQPCVMRCLTMGF